MEPRTKPVFRFAPSPNGLLHLGHAYSALLNQAAARSSDGRLLLRIEDIDRERSRPEFEAAIREDLGWLGISWEEPVRRQSERLETYRAALAELDRLELLYPAFLSRAEIQAEVAQREAAGRRWPRDPDGAALYPGVERDWTEDRRRHEMASGRPYALRLDMARALSGRPALAWQERPSAGQGVAAAITADPAAWGDVILARRDMPGSYHLCVVVDDADQGVTEVVRGRDLYAATSVHRLLQTLLGLLEPAYHHHALMLDGSSRKLSKSRGSESLRAQRQVGASPDALAARLLASATMPP